MIRDGLLDETQTGDLDTMLHIRKENPDELMPTVLETTQIVDKFDCDWLLLRVNESAPKEPRSIFKRTSFPKANRDVISLDKLSVRIVRSLFIIFIPSVFLEYSSIKYGIMGCSFRFPFPHLCWEHPRSRIC